MKHTRENQARLDWYNKGVSIAEGLSGGGNYAPQNSGVIMLSCHLAKPIYDHRGYMCKTGSYAQSVAVRGKENALIAIERGAVDYGFSFMRVLAVEDYPLSAQMVKRKRATRWEWVRPGSVDDAMAIIAHNEDILCAN